MRRLLTLLICLTMLITETGCESLTVFDRNCYELPLE